MKFHSIDVDEWQALREIRLHGDAVLHCFCTGELDNLADRSVDLQAILSGWCFLDEIANSPDDISCSTVILDDVSECLTRLLEFRRLMIQEPQGGLGRTSRRSAA